MKNKQNDFEIYREEAMQSADMLCKRKSGAYSVGGVQTRDYWRYHGVKALAFEIYKRALRMVSTTQQNLTAKQMADSLEDMALDHINYGAFLYAESRCRVDDAIENGEAFK